MLNYKTPILGKYCKFSICHCVASEISSCSKTWDDRDGTGGKEAMNHVTSVVNDLLIVADQVLACISNMHMMEKHL